MSKRTLKIFHTSDIHGHFLSVDYAKKGTTQGGIARVASFLKEHRNPGDLYIDTGDVLQGNALAYYLAKHPQTPHPFAEVMNYLKCDYLTLGNHDFNFGKPVLKSFRDAFQGTLLNANIMKNDSPFCGVPYHIKTLANGLKMGIIGVTTHYIPNWENPSHIERLSFLDAFATVKKTVALIKDQVDLIVVNYHGGFEGDIKTGKTESHTGENQGLKMLKEISDIDILLTGHQHQTLLERVGDTFISQPGMNALGVNVITIPLDEPFDPHQITGAHIQMKDTPEDAGVLDRLKDGEVSTQKYLDQPIGSFDQAYPIEDGLAARKYKHPLVTWINHVQLNATGADIALCGLGNDVTGFNQAVTLRDVLATYVYPNLLVVKKMTGQALKEALEKTAAFFTLKDGKIAVSEAYEHPKKEYYNYDMYDPITYTIDVKEPVGNRIHDLMFKGQKINPDDTFKVAMNNYRAAGGGDYVMIQESPLILETQTEIVDLLIEAIAGQTNLALDDPKNITIRGE